MRKPQITPTLVLIWLTFCAQLTVAQQPDYAREIRGYKVERAVVAIKKPSNGSKEPKKDSTDPDFPDQLIRFADPRLVRVTPLGISLEVSIVVAPVEQRGRADFLVFEDMVVNGTSVEIDEYHRAFDLPDKKPETLKEPLRFFIYLPRALLAAIDEWNNSKEAWVVTGRVYVFGKFKKGIFSFKRCIPVELNLTMRNLLKNPS